MIKKIFLAFLVTFFLSQFLYAQQTDLVTSLKKHVYTLASDSMLGRGFGFTAKRMTVDYITAEFLSAGLKPLKDGYIHNFILKNDMVSMEGFNIAGVIEGSDPVLKSEYLVLGAHFDHLGYKLKEGEKIIYNGADDNASGTAAIIEIGRRLSADRHLLKRSVIIVAFDGEEIGLKGSNNFLSEKIVESEKIRLMLGLDMVGMYEKNEGVEFNGIYSLEHGLEMLEKTLEKNPVKIKKTGKLVEMRTDTWSFSKMGIPSVHVFTGEISPYHKPEDDRELLDYTGMAKITEFLVSFTETLSCAEELNPDKQVMKKSIDPSFRAGFNYKIGSGSFNYQKEFYHARSLFSFESGLVFQFKISNHFTLQPEFLYQTSASKSSEGDTRRHSVSPQLNILLTTQNNMKDKPFGYLLLGGYYSYHFAGNAEGRKMDFESYYDPQEEGINFGIGLQVYKFQIGFIRKWGVTNIYHDKDAGSALYNCKYFSMLYFF